MSDLEEITTFRNQLAIFVSYVMTNYHNAGPGGPQPAAIEHIQREQVVLTQEYGRLRQRIRKAAGGTGQLNTPAFGIISQDVIVDAINRWDWHNWGDAVTGAQQHLDLAIGQLRANGPAFDPDRFWRLTSPIYWVLSLARIISREARVLTGIVRRALRTWAGRGIVAVAALLVAGVLYAVGARLVQLV